MFEDIQGLLSFLSILLFSATDSLHLLQIPAKNHVFPWVTEGTIHFDPPMLHQKNPRFFVGFFFLIFLYFSAIASISQSTPLGSALTATQLRAGLEVKYFA